MRAPMLLLLVVAGAACRGETPAEAPERPPVAPRPFGLEAEGSDHAVVATVDGRPVHADCVARQAAAHDLDARAALDECIGFELLAAEAERRGYLADAEVQEAGKREAVRALVEAEFELDGPEDLPLEEVQKAWERHRGAINRPELRTSYYCRAQLEHEEPDDSEEERAARAKVEALHRELAGREVSLEEFRRRCTEVVGDDEAATRLGLQHSPIQMIRSVHDDGTSKRLARPGEAIDRTYSRAVFDIPEERQVSPPTRVRWGWDLLYVREIHPAVELSFEEAEPKLREGLYKEDVVRQSLFRRWARTAGEGVEVEVHPERLPPEEDPRALVGQDG